jgi:hypothetical protein
LELRLLVATQKHGACSQRGALTSLVHSLQLFYLLLVLKLMIENVFVTVLSYMPFVTPFWCIPD